MDVFSMEKPTNLAHTTAALPFHMDNCWYESPPGLQFLHCIRLDMSIYHTTAIYWCEIEILCVPYSQKGRTNYLCFLYLALVCRLTVKINETLLLPAFCQ